MISQGLFRTCRSWTCFLSFSVFVVVMCLLCLLTWSVCVPDARGCVGK
jgi:hypothetical protein